MYMYIHVCMHINLHVDIKYICTVVETKEAGKLVRTRTENGDTFMMKTEGQDTTTGYPTLERPFNAPLPL